MTVIAVRRCARAPHCRARRVRIAHRPMLMRSPLARDRRRPPGFIRPAQPILAEQPPIGPDWLYGVKHDGFRIVARKRPEGLHLWSRNGREWSVEFAGIATALKAWKLQSFVIGGKACADACYFAFDLLELDGVDLRGLPFGERYARLARLLAGAPELIHLSEHINEYDGAAMFEHACRLGL